MYKINKKIGPKPDCGVIMTNYVCMYEVWSNNKSYFNFFKKYLFINQ